MKKLLQNFTNLSVSTLFAIILLSSCGKLDKIDGIEALPDPSSTSRAEQCELIVSGRIVNTKNLEPIAGAIISGEQFTTKTNTNGEFSATLSLAEDDIVDDITVSKEGFLDKKFKAFYGSVVQLNNCPAITNIDWDIALSERQEGVWVGEKEGAWYKIMDTVATRVPNSEGIEETVLFTNVYTVDIQRGSFDEWRNVVISPNHSRAMGPGLPIEVSNFVLVHFDIEVLWGSNGVVQQSASSRGEDLFLKPLEITFPLPEAFGGEDLGKIDLEDLGIEQTGFPTDHNGDIIYFETEDGQHCIAFNPLLAEVIQPALEAIQREASLEEINKIITDGLASVGGQGIGATEITLDEKRDGRLAGSAQLYNCNCGNPNLRSYTADLDGFEQLDIRFPSSVSDLERIETINTLRTLLGVSGTGDQAVDLTVSVDKCSTAQINSKEIVRRVKGKVRGYSFVYQATDRLETTVEVGACPTTTPCHQGCPD